MTSTQAKARTRLTIAAKTLALAVVSALAYAASATAQDARKFDVPPQEAAAALRIAAVQGDFEILIPPKLAEGKRTKEVRGTFEPNAALTKMLDGSGLAVRAVGAGTYVLEERPGNMRGTDRSVPSSKRSAVEPQEPILLAQAQSPAAPVPQDAAALAQPPANPPARKAPASAAVVLETVVVTAQQRAQSVEEVPISMTVLGQDALEKTRAGTLADLQQLVPNFSVVQSSGVNTITVRGVGGGGRNIGFDTRVGVYLDGIYMGQAQAAGQPLYDIEQVEVLRGPQGHLFGRNTVAGAVNITTRAPSQTIEGSFRAVAGNHNTVEGYGSVSGPLGEKVAGKISVGYESRDGYTTNLFNNDKLDDLKRVTTRGQLTFQPTGQLKINFYADYADIKQNTVLGEAITSLFGVPFAGGLYPRRTVNYNTTPYVDNRLSGVSLTANYEMEGGNTLTAISGYRDTRQTRANDTDYTQFDLVRIDYADNFKQKSQEIRIASPNKGPLRYVAGVYAMNETADTSRTVSIGKEIMTVVTFPGVGQVPLGALLRLVPNTAVPSSGTVKTDAVALFGSLDYDIVKNLTLNLGARYTREKKDEVYNLNGAASGRTGIGTLVGNTDNRSDNKLTPTVGVTVALAKTINAYAKYSTGFKSGGWNLDFLTPAQISNKFSFNTETVQSYELGLKGTALGRRVQYDLAVFQSKFKDFQVSQFLPLGAGSSTIVLRNAAKAESTGAEASFRALVTGNLGIGANIGLLKAVFKSFPGGTSTGLDAAGKRLPDAPSLTAAVTTDYGMQTPGGRFDFYGEYSFRRKSYTGADNDETLERLDSRDIVNARLTYTPDNSRWGLSVWARNLFDNDYTTTRGRDFFGNQFIKRGDPRAFGAEARYNF